MRKWVWNPWARRFIGWIFEHMSFAIPIRRLRETDTLWRSITQSPRIHFPAYRLIVNGGDYQDFPQLHFHLISSVGTGGRPSVRQNK